MTRVLEFRVHGIPVPQAGTKSVPAGRTGDGRQIYRKVTEGGKDLLPWRQDMSKVAADALAAEGGTAFTGPVRVDVEFRFPMPPSRPKALRLVGTAWKTTKPDADKLFRAVGDSLTAAGVLGDDAIIVVHLVSKLEVHNSWTGANIRIRALDPHGAL